MKKLLLLSAFILILGCSKEDNECNCSKAQYINWETNGTYYVNNVPIDCETGRPIKDGYVDGGTFVECKD